MKDGTWDKVWMGLDSRIFSQLIIGLKLSPLSPSEDHTEYWYWVLSQVANDSINLPASTLN